MRSALWLLPVLMLAGCGDMYYQTRYIPASVDSTYSPAERLTWTGDKEVYELPANPPAVDGLYDATRRSRIDCKIPGQQFKSQPMVGIGDSARHPEVAEAALLARYDQDPQPGLPFGPQKGTPVAAWQDADPRGAREPIGLVPVAGDDRGPYPFRGSGTLTNPVLTVAAYRSDQIDWCTAHPGSLTPTP